jgi:hypothetical protein
VAQLSDFWGIHYGEAIVVCGLGNSINSFRDPHRFRTVGVNDIGRAFTPDYLFCMDARSAFPRDRLGYIQESRAQYIFTNRDLGFSRDNVVPLSIRKADSPRLDDPDALYHIGSPTTSPFMALCLAAHMGAKAIGLTGVDFTNGHFFAADGVHKLAGALPGIDERFFLLGSALLERGVKVFNLSAESKLRAFPRLSVDQFYALQQSGRMRSWTRPARRVYFYARVPADHHLTTLVRLINSETTLSCRLIAPGSADIPAGSMSEIEQQIVTGLATELDRAVVPKATFSESTFSSIWNEHLSPRLFGRQVPLHRNGMRRRLTFRVIVSQEQATPDELTETVRSLCQDLLPADEIIVVGRDCASADIPSRLRSAGRIRYSEQLKGESFVAARSRAATQSSRDILLFTDANIQVPMRWVEPLVEAFQNPRAAAVGPALVDMYKWQSKGFGMRFSDAELSTVWLPRAHRQPYPVPLLPNAFLAVRRPVFERLGGFDPGMRFTGGDDLEFCFGLWIAGFECWVLPSLEVAWMNPFTARGIRSHEHWGDLLYNLLRLATIHFGPKRLGSFIQSVSSYPQFPAACTELLRKNPVHRRQQVQNGRKYSDDWFFQRFPD